MLTLLARMDALARSSGLAVLLLVASNAIPIVGVLLLGWQVQTLLVLYWIESGVVGLVNVLKMARAEGVPAQTTMRPAVGSASPGCARAFMIPFFVFHYGLFWVVHGVFVFLLPVFALVATSLPGRGPAASAAGGSLSAEGLAFAAVALFVSHLVSYHLNFIGGGEYQRVSIQSQMAQPYGRVVVLHLTIILGGMLIFVVDQPVALLIVLVIGKTVLDLIFHLRAHRNVQAPPGVLA